MVVRKTRDFETPVLAQASYRHMLKNILESLPGVLGNTREAARKEAAVEMRDGLDALLDIFHKPGDLRMLRDAMVAARDAAP
jgi:hypothetical protein